MPTSIKLKGALVNSNLGMEEQPGGLGKVRYIGTIQGSIPQMEEIFFAEKMKQEWTVRDICVQIPKRDDNKKLILKQQSEKVLAFKAFHLPVLEMKARFCL